MTLEPQTDSYATSISTQTERVLHDFVRNAVSHLSEALKDSAPEWEDDTRWERGTDGHFRERKKRTRMLFASRREAVMLVPTKRSRCGPTTTSDFRHSTHV